jgi:hypothetical protein
MKLLSKDPPFLFMILIGAMSWTVTHIVSRTLEKPIIEYVESSPDNMTDLIPCGDKPSSKSSKIVRFEITNISQKKKFTKMEFLIVAKNGSIYGVRMRAVAPAVSGETSEKCYPTHAEFVDMSLHPGASFQLDVGADAGTELSLRLKSSLTPVNLVSKNLETWMIMYEARILLVFLLIVAVGVIWFLIKVKQPNENEASINKDEANER